MAVVVCGALLACHAESRPPAVANSPEVSASPAARQLAQRALASRDPNAPAVQQLRRQGQPGLDALLQVARSSGQLEPDYDPLFDAVAQQRYSRYSGLYWYTDLDRAKAEAESSGRRILSLRMLGNLSDELSCANSRFFRVVLYPDPAVSKVLRQHFVLHWSSERAVPKITVDYGDGRRLVRTVTGNSAHYVLDSNGRVLHVLPGLYHAGAFIGSLSRVPPVKAASAALVKWHGTEAAALGVNWQEQLTRPNPPALNQATSAALAIPLAVSKAIVEAPMVPSFTPKPIEADARQADWDKLAKLEALSVRLSDNSIALIRELSQRGLDAQGRIIDLEDADVTRMLKGFQSTLAEDTVRNLHSLQRRVHEYLAKHPHSDFETVNEFIYSQLFLTPASDPWLGLAAPGAFTGLPDAGIESPNP